MTEQHRPCALDSKKFVQEVRELREEQGVRQAREMRIPVPVMPRLLGDNGQQEDAERRKRCHKERRDPAHRR